MVRCNEKISVINAGNGDLTIDCAFVYGELDDEQVYYRDDENEKN